MSYSPAITACPARRPPLSQLHLPLWRKLVWLYGLARHLFCSASKAEPIPDDAADELLMAAYRGGDQAAFRKLFDRFAPRILGAALRRGLSPADANDAVQQTFVHVHQSRKEFKSGALVRPWIYTIAFNVMRDYGRRLSSQKRLMERFKVESEVASAGSTSEPEGQRSVLQSALNLLSPAQREVLVLHYFEDMSFGDIARMIGRREGAVRVRAHRGYEKLRSLLAGKKAKRGSP